MTQQLLLGLDKDMIDSCSYKIELLPALEDNYVPVLYNLEEQKALVVDPACASTVEDFLKTNDLELTHILNTHHHLDHVGGNLSLKEKYPHLEIIGLDSDCRRIPGITIKCQPEETLQIGELKARVLFLPGHTLGHCAYYFEELGALFSGDVLFSCGCGRLFEGTAEQMWQSLLQIRELPDETQIYCAHEYTLNNIEFARHILPDDEYLEKFQRQCQQLRHGDIPTVPMTLESEKRLNPFLRCDQYEIQEATCTVNQGATETFAELRKLKDFY